VILNRSVNSLQTGFAQKDSENEESDGVDDRLPPHSERGRQDLSLKEVVVGRSCPILIVAVSWCLGTKYFIFNAD